MNAQFFNGLLAQVKYRFAADSPTTGWLKPVPRTGLTEVDKASSCGRAATPHVSMLCILPTFTHLAFFTAFTGLGLRLIGP